MSRRPNRQRANRRQRQRYKTIVVPGGSLNPEVDNVIRLPEHLKHQPVLVVQQRQKGQGPQQPPPTLLQAAQPPSLQLTQPPPLQSAQPPTQVVQPQIQAANPPLSKGLFEPVVIPQTYIPETLAFRADKEPHCQALTVKYRREDPDKTDSDDEEESTTEEEEEEDEEGEGGDSVTVVRTRSKSKDLLNNESILCACSSSRHSHASCMSCRSSSRPNMSRSSCLSCNSSAFGLDMPRNVMPFGNTGKPIYGILQPGFCRRRSKPPLPRASFDPNRSILHSTPPVRPPPSIVHPVRNSSAQASQRPLYYRHPAPKSGRSNVRPVPPQSILSSRQPSFSHHKCDDCDPRKTE